MDDFLQDKPRKSRGSLRGRSYRRLFVLVFAAAVLWQCVSFLQMQLSDYHRTLREDFKVVLAVTRPTDNAALEAVGESLSAKEDILAVKLFSPQDALSALKSQNPRLAGELVALGREPMPAYFELKLAARALNNAPSFVNNIKAEYPQLSVHYSADQARWAFYSGLCLRTVNMGALAALGLFVLFMFMVEAQPSRGAAHAGRAAALGLLAGVLSLGLFVLMTWPTGYLEPALRAFTSPERQAGIFVFCALFGWTLSKWQRF